MNPKILVIGSGGREHAIVDALSRSPQHPEIYCAPGNAGTTALAQNIPIRDTDIEDLLAFAKKENISLTIVGPEASLAAGIVDVFRTAGLLIFGHTALATRIESSKEFAKELMCKYDIPTAGYRSFSDYEEAVAYVAARPFPAVLKYDGLAAGKGVVIAENIHEAQSALKNMLADSVFGSGKVIIEDFLSGPEFSFMCFVDGEHVYPMPPAQDHKRAFDHDKGPNTGGMGAYTSLPFITDEDKRFAYENILCRTAHAMCEEGCPLSGVLYGGLIKTAHGIKVIEFNARFGDPETEVVLPLLQSDFYEICRKIALQEPISNNLNWSDEVTLGVVLASKGYPGSYKKGFPITGIEDVNATVFQMGTALLDGKLVTAGGRVLMVVTHADSIQSAHQKAYIEIEKIKCNNLFFRNDIAHCALDN